MPGFKDFRKVPVHVYWKIDLVRLCFYLWFFYRQKLLINLFRFMCRNSCLSYNQYFILALHASSQSMLPLSFSVLWWSDDWCLGSFFCGPLFLISWLIYGYFLLVWALSLFEILPFDFLEAVVVVLLVITEDEQTKSSFQSFRCVVYECGRCALHFFLYSNLPSSLIAAWKFNYASFPLLRWASVQRWEWIFYF